MFARIILIIALVFNACQNDGIHQSIDLNRNDVVSVFDMFDRVDIIPLETHPDALLGAISRVKFFDGNYYILDMKTQQVFCFDRQGRFNFKISAQGSGPGEYTFANYLTIDSNKQQILLLDAISQRILFFDLEGNFRNSLTIPVNKAMGFVRCYVINESILLLTTMGREHLVFFDKTKNEVNLSDTLFYTPADLHAFSPHFNVYQHNNRTYALPALSRELFDVSGSNAVPYFKWCFGRSNNSPRQIIQLIEEKSNRSFSERMIFLFEAVGKGKILNYHIIKVFETNRFKMAFLEFENDYKHVVIDKKMNNTHVFNSFKEGISLVFEHMQSDRVITHDKRIDAFMKELGIPELYNRTNETFNVETFSEHDREIILNHDPMTDNPFLVVYKFKE